MINSLPTILTNYLLGLAIDRKGVGVVMMGLAWALMASFTILVVNFWAYWEGWYWAFLAGRLGVGVSGSGLVMCSQVVISHYIHPDRKVLYLGLINILPWIFYSLNNLISPQILSLTNQIRSPLLFG